MFNKQLFVILISCGLVACATSETDPLQAEYDALPQGSDCIFEGTIRDYRVLDDKNLVVTASVDDNTGKLEAIRIASIRALTPEEHEELLVRFGKMEPDIEQTPVEESVDTAEVEELD